MKTAMKIERAEVIVTSPDRNFVTLQLTTDTGITGLGDGTLNGRELAVVAYLSEYVVPLLLGRDASRIEDTWQFLYRSAYWRRGPVTMASIAAVDMALWDIKGKAAGMPVYQLLGGASRDGLLAYGHASGQDLPELFASIRAEIAAGYRAIRVQSGIPGLNQVYGLASSQTLPGNQGVRYDYEPAQRAALPLEEHWDTRAYLRHIPGVFAAVRREFGPQLPLLHDCHHRLKPIEAATLGKALESYDLVWLEDCIVAENQHMLEVVRAHTSIPLAIGEVYNAAPDFIDLIRNQLIDYVRASCTHFGGITPLKKLMAYAELYGIRSGFHGPTDISPVGFAALLHLGLALHNYGIQEYMPQGPRTNEVFAQTMRFRDGYLHPGDEPGLGVSIDCSKAAAFPYKKAYLPFCRLADGTVHDW